MTTNFDQLLEKALEAVGVNPTVISTPDAIEGALPLTHTKCLVIKVHGDYLDTRIKNTPTELEQYDESLNRLLDRVFDEFGLIACGWSAEWDTALREAIERCPNRRFTTFWAARGEPRGMAKNLLKLRSGVRVPIQDADSFFQELAEKVLSLREIDKPHPLSAKVAVASLKKYLVDDRYRIRLHDLVMQEVEKLYSELSPEHFPLGSPFSTEELIQRVQRYESLTEVLTAVMATGCYWGEQSQEYLWANSLERIVNPPSIQSRYLEVWSNLSSYPALLLLYAGGIAALAAGRYSTFATLLLKPKVRDGSRSKSLVLSLYTLAVMEQNIGHKLPNMDRRYTPVSDYLYNVLREPLRELLPDEDQYQKYFDCFEYLFAIIQADLYQKQMNHLWGQPGSFAWRARYSTNGGLLEEDEFDRIITSLLERGFFDRSRERFLYVDQEYKQLLSNLRWH